MQESDFIDAINADPDDRFTQLVYADWLDEQGDPRAEAWRVLIEAGKRPLRNDLYPEMPYEWFLEEDRTGDEANSIGYDLFDANPEVYSRFYETFHAAMDAAAIAWVRANRDADFLRWEVCDFCKGSGQSFAVDGIDVVNGKQVAINPRPAACMCCEGLGRCKVGEQLPPGQPIR
jgi:uncharacterized protein (TIGR02996 family)